MDTTIFYKPGVLWEMSAWHNSDIFFFFKYFLICKTNFPWSWYKDTLLDKKYRYSVKQPLVTRTQGWAEGRQAAGVQTCRRQGCWVFFFPWLTDLGSWLELNAYQWLMSISKNWLHFWNFPLLICSIITLP